MTELDDRRLAELWAETSRREYAVAIVLRYLPLLYGVALKLTGSDEGACEAVRAFAGGFAPDGARMYDRFCGQHAKAQVLKGARAEFLLRLVADDEGAVAHFEEARAGLPKPQRVSMEMLLREGRTLGTIAAETGYLIDHIRHYVEAGVDALVPADETMPMAVDDDHTALYGHFLEYVKGNRTGAEANRIEVWSMVDPLLSDALDGVFAVDGDHVRRIVALERELVAACSAPRRHGRAMWVAAAACLLVVGVFLVVLTQRGTHGGAADRPVKAVDSGGDATIARGGENVTAIPPDTTAGVDAKVALSDTVGDVNMEPDGMDVPERAVGLAIADTSARIAGRVTLTTISTDEQTGRRIAAPQIGRQRYNEYLAENAMAPGDGVQGDVTLTFHVNDYGRPSRIRVVGFLSQEAHSEAIRLLNSGPEWTHSDREVTVVMRFE